MILFDILIDIHFLSIGLSCKTQEIYLIVFCMRYSDLFMYYVSLYNTLMKIFFISATAFIIFMIRFKKPYCTVSQIFNIVCSHISGFWTYHIGQNLGSCQTSDEKFSFFIILSLNISFYLIRLMMLLVMISHIWWHFYQPLWFWHASFSQDGLHGSLSGAIVSGLSLLLSCHRLLCLTK